MRFELRSSRTERKLATRMQVKDDRVMANIEWADFERVELRVGTVVESAPNTQARTPAYVLTIDLGEAGIKTSSAQVTEHYDAEVLLGRQVLCACNFPPKKVAGVKSEVLVTGAYDAEHKVVLAGFDHPIPNGTRLL